MRQPSAGRTLLSLFIRRSQIRLAEVRIARIRPLGATRNDNVGAIAAGLAG
jgi:hypothetical protein